MLEMVSMIPEEIGWTLVNSTVVLCGVMMVLIGKNLIEIWKEFKEKN